MTLQKKPRREGHKVVLRLAHDDFDALHVLCCSPAVAHDDTETTKQEKMAMWLATDGTPCYAEAARALLAGELLGDRSMDLMVAAAILVNAPMIMTACSNRIIGGMHADLVRLTALATHVPELDLRRIHGSPGQPKSRISTRPRAPVLHIPLESWLYARLRSMCTNVSPDDMRRDKRRSPMAFVVGTTLTRALERPSAQSMIGQYVQTIRRIRESITASFEVERRALLRGFKVVDPGFDSARDRN